MRGSWLVRYSSSLKKPGLKKSLLLISPVTTFIGTAAFLHSQNKTSSAVTKTNPGLIRKLCSTSDINCTDPADIANYLKSGRLKKVVVMAGAGISTPSGIPDFRTPGTGLYDNLQKYKLPYPEAIFDIEYFTYDQKPFYTLAQELYPSGYYRPNIVHYFVKLLQLKGLLLRMYTQNIDGLERLAGIPEDSLVEAHGSFSTATCRVCRKSYKGEDIKEAIFKGDVPRCTSSLCNGVIKPDIVFFGENLPFHFYSFAADMPQADLLIIMGTSLEVYPFAGIAEATLPGVPRILFNKEICGPFSSSPRANDVVAEGDLVEQVEAFCNELGWQEELKELMKASEENYKLKISQTLKSEE